MDLSVYLMTAVIATFAVGAAAGLWLSIVGGHWRHLDDTARLILEDDEPAPIRNEEAFPCL